MFALGCDYIFMSYNFNHHNKDKFFNLEHNYSNDTSVRSFHFRCFIVSRFDWHDCQTVRSRVMFAGTSYFWWYIWRCTTVWVKRDLNWSAVIVKVLYSLYFIWFSQYFLLLHIVQSSLSYCLLTCMSNSNSMLLCRLFITHHVICSPKIIKITAKVPEQWSHF